MAGITYKDSGVDLDIYQESMKRLPRLMHRTFSPRVRQLDGGFAGLFELDFDSRLFRRNYQDPVLVACTDGVGTKLKVAQLTDRHDTVGIDLVAMCVNDAICCGAEPLFFLDYIAMSHDDPQRLEQIVKGISDGCIAADCALLGGETAIMPDLYQPGDYDLAGFCVGVVERKQLIDGRNIQPDDVVIGVASSGIHSNGFSLVRRIVLDHAGLKLSDPFVQGEETVVGKSLTPTAAQAKAWTPISGETSIADTLLTPTTIYVEAVRRVLTHYKRKNVVHGIAHITGGGLAENITRILPAGLRVNIDGRSWPLHPVFPWLQKLGNVAQEEMYRVFNMGIGLVFIVSPFYAESVKRIVQLTGHDAWTIGVVLAASDTEAKSDCVLNFGP